MPLPYNVFTIYAREDARLLSELLSHLKPLENSGRIKVWSDREINPGVHWEEEIVSHLDTSDIILILVSPAYYNSEYIHRVEIKRAVERHQRGKATVLPIIVRPCTFEDDPVVSSLQVLPTDGKAVTDDEHWRNQDKAWLDVIKGVKRTLAAFSVAEQPAQKTIEKGEQKSPTTLTWEQNLNIGDRAKTISKANGSKSDSLSRRGSLSINFDTNRVAKLFGIFLLFLAFYLSIAFISYLFSWKNDHDIVFRFSWEMFMADVQVHNWLGGLGAFLSDSIIYWGFGASSFGIVYLLYKYGLALIRLEPLIYLGITFQHTISLMIVTSVATSFFFQKFEFPLGGVLGQSIAGYLQDILGVAGSTLLLAISILFAVPMFRKQIMAWSKKFN